jgi:putative transcriptional regulator
MFDMTIYNRLKILIAEKEFREKRKLTYRTISQETGISTSTLTKYMGQDVKSFDTATLETLCTYFNVQPGDILTFADSLPTPNQ